MRTIKAFCSAFAVATVSVCLAVSASAEVVKLTADAYDASTGVIDATDNYTATDGQMTALVVEASKWNNIDETPITSSDILYINQFDADDAAATLSNIGLNGLLTEDVEYYVLLGGEGVAEADIQVLSLIYTKADDKPKVLIGDVNGSTTINMADMTALSRYIANPAVNALNGYDYVDAADVNCSATVNMADMTALSRYVANPTENTFKYEYTYEKADDEHVLQN